MKNIIRNGALALSVIAGAALVAAPATTAMAKSIQRDGYFGGTWSPIGPRNNRHAERYHRHYGYYGPHGRYAYYGPRYGYYGGPYYYGPRAGHRLWYHHPLTRPTSQMARDESTPNRPARNRLRRAS